MHKNNTRSVGSATCSRPRSEHLFSRSFGRKGGKMQPSFDPSGSRPRHELFSNFDGSAADVRCQHYLGLCEPGRVSQIFRTKVDAHMWHRSALSNSWQTKTIRASSSTGTSSQATARYALSRTVRKAVTPHLIAPAPRHGLRSCTRTCGGSSP